MRIIGFGSVRGAPGVTTTAHLVAGSLRPPAFVLEADLQGASLAVRYGLGREPGLTTFVTADPGDPDGWKLHAQDAGGVPVIVGPDAPDNARSMWSRAGTRIARLLTDGDASCIVDLGRLGENIPLGGHLDLLAVLVRPIAEDLVTFSHQLPMLRTQTSKVAVVLVGTGDYRDREVANDLSIDVVGAIPYDRRAAEILCGRGRMGNLKRTALVRAASSLADSLTTVLDDHDRDMEPVS